MTRKARWTLVMVVPLLVVVKARLLVWAVGLPWTPEHANGTLLFSGIAGVMAIIAGSMIEADGSGK